MALTKVTGHVVKPDTNIQFHNTKSTGIVTFAHTDNATSSTTGALQVTGGVGIVKDLHVGGNVTVGGTLTYDDVTNIDSLGIITARGGIHVGPPNAGVATVSSNGSASFTGIVTTSSTLFADHFSTSGVGTFADINVKSHANDTRITSIAPGALILSRTTPVIYLKNNLSDNFDASIELQSNEIRFRGGGNNATGIRMETTSSGVSFPQNIDVDGHTELDNTNIVGVATVNGNFNVLNGNILQTKTGSNPTITLSRNESVGDEQAIGTLNFANNTANTINARVAAYSDGTGNVGGHLYFETRDPSNSILSERLRIKSSGEVGIGTDNPNNPLTVHGSGNHIFLKDTATGNVFQIRHASGVAEFNTYGTGGARRDFVLNQYTTEVLRITSGGDINIPGGLGTQIRFENQHSVTTDAAISTFDDAAGTLLSLGSNFYFNGSGAENRFNTSEESCAVTLNRNGYVSLKTGGTGATATTRFSVAPDGKVLIDNATGTLTIGGDNVYDSAKINLMVGSSSQTSATTEATALVIHDQNSRRNGTEGAGSWKSKITFRSTQINGNNQSEGASIVHDITYNNYSSNKMRSDLVFKTRGDAQTSTSDAATEKLRIRHDGNVGVGEDSPQRHLHVTGGASTGCAHFGVFGTNAGNAYIGNTPVVTISTDGNANAGTNDEKAIFQVGRGGGGAGAAAVTTEHLRVTLGGTTQIGGVVGSNSDIDLHNTKLTIKQSANNREDGIYIERSGERRGWLMFVGGSYNFNDAFCLSTNQNGTKTDVLSIDRGNVLAKIGGSVIIDSTNNGYGGLKIYDDSSGGYNVNYIGGRSDGNMAHVFKMGGRSQNQSPWVDSSGSEIMRVSLSNGLQLQGDTDSALQYHTGDHYKFKTGGKDAIHVDNRRVAAISKLTTKAQCFSSCTTKWASSRSVMKFYMDFYTGNSSATYHFMRLISQPDWSFDDIVIRQTRYQYHPASGDHATRRYYTWYGGHYEQIINYNQKDGGSGTSAESWIVKRDNFGPSGSFKIHEAANGGYYRDAWGSDYAITLGNYIGVRLEITVYNTTGVYDTSRFATASDFYPAAYGGTASQSDADSWGGPRGVWFNTTSNGTGTGTAPVLRMHDNAATGWNTGSNYFDVSA